ncbi:elongation factor G [Dongia soli]|uniref:Elongation factor G n=1 Tax=Dongia soli TaxID=600628 RepID=A0ABU5EBE4_9PROT|nr:elongation factor G [Dongia soli]MDY0883320.1 elongation factor G [Dongia soli]
MPGRDPTAPRCAALIGPYLSGKTALFESLLYVTNALHRKGTAKEGNTLGDASPEARQRKMSVEPTAAVTQYLNEDWCFIDCPGSVEFNQDTRNVLMIADVAVVVIEPVVERALALTGLFKYLDDHDIPHLIFINKMDVSAQPVREVLSALQSVSARPLLLRQVPIREAGKNGDVITGYVDLVSERAYHYQPGRESALIQLPNTILAREQEARGDLLEHLADFDDDLLEQLLSDAQPSNDAIYHQIAKDLAADLIVPVLLGAAEKDHGVRRLLKALRHDVPGPDLTVQRLHLQDKSTAALIYKTVHQPHAGKLSFARILAGKLTDGMTLNGQRVAGLMRPKGNVLEKTPQAGFGEVVALGRLDQAKTGDLLQAEGTAARHAEWPEPLAPLFALAMGVENRNDEVKLTAALAKLTEEDTSLTFGHDPDTHELLLHGQGEIHLQVAIERLKSRYNLPVRVQRPQVSYRETIRHKTAQHARFKRQSGGHGQFGDVHIEVWPLERGQGFLFEDRIVGGAIPRQFIGSVQDGVKDYLGRGPLGFPVVDVAVALCDGQYHSVDSSDQAFKTAGRMAMQEALPKCDPVLLEPIYQVEISAPNEFTSRVHGLISSRRGQILQFAAKPDWPGWESIEALMPQSEILDLVIELRSLTQGVGNFTAHFDHLQELTGRLAEKVIEQRRAAQ